MDTFVLNLASASQEFEIPEYRDTQEVCHLGIFTFDVVPSAGTISVDYDPGINRWFPVQELQNKSIADSLEVRFSSPVSKVRVRTSGLTGGSGGKFYLFHASEWFADGAPKGAYRGDRAITVQSYTEANVKRGVQYEVSSLNPALAGSGVQDTLFTTGAVPVIVKARQVGFNGPHLTAQVFRSPTFTGGTVVPYFNLDDIDPVTGTVVVRAGATITVVGTEFGAPTYMVGSSGLGGSTVGTFAAVGAERILRPNTTYMLRITNTDTNPQRVAAYLTWYEGNTDL